MRVGFNKLDVYQDGSTGGDNWSMTAKCKVNDREVPLTNMEVMPRTDVSDNCTGGLAGPKGSGSHCRYDSFWTAPLSLAEGDDVRCGAEGRAWDNAQTVPFSEFRYTVKATNAPVSDKFGTGANSTEYWLGYSLEFPK